MGIFDAFIDDRDVRLIGVEAGGEADQPRPPRRAVCRRQRRRPAGHAHVRAAGRGRQHRADAFDLGGARLRGRRTRARLAARHRPRRVRACHPTPRRSRRFRRWRGWKAFCRRSNRRTRSPTRGSWRRELGPSAVLLVNLSGRGDKDVQTVEKALDRQVAADDKHEDTELDHLTCLLVLSVTGFADGVAHREAFARIRAEGPGLVTYTTAGDPDLARSGEILKALDRAGADVSRSACRSPIRWPTARSSSARPSARSRRAAACGRRWRSSRRFGRAWRRRSWSSATRTRCCAWGSSRSPKAAAAAGVDGVLALDLPIEEAAGFRETLAAAGLDTIFLLSPTTTDARIRKAAELGRGFPVRDLAAGRDRRARSRRRRAPKRWCGGFARRRRCRSRWASAFRGRSTWPKSPRMPTRRSSAARSSR